MEGRASGAVRRRWCPNGVVGWYYIRFMQKEYGKLTADQFREFIGKLPELRQQRDAFGQLLADVPKEKFDTLMVEGYNWGEIYEYTFSEHVAIAIVAFNELKWLNEASQAPDPQQHVLDNWPTEESVDDDVHPGFDPQARQQRQG